MRPLALLHRARGLAAVVAAGLALAVAPQAHAESTGDAEAKAKAILAQVQKIQEQVKQAEDRYDAALSGVADSVNVALLSGRASDQIQQQATQASDELDNRIRGLYMSGGPLALYATLLSSGDIADLQARVVLVDHVVHADRDLVQQDSLVVAAAKAQANAADRIAKKRIETERDVAKVATRVLTLLKEQQDLLAQANARVSQLQALDRARAAMAAQAAAFNGITRDRINSLGVLPPSPLYLSLYHRAAQTCAGMSWTVLAAIGQVESAHGRNPSTSYAGAMGPMQFLPSTFNTYGVDGNHDGILDIMDPYDAIYTAAAYLCANGAGGGGDALYNAIWHYNHADWYVQMVLALAKKYETWAG